MISSPIVHHPLNIDLGSFHLFGHLVNLPNITGFGIALALAFATAHWVAQHVLDARGDDSAMMNDVTMVAVIGTILGGKVYYALLEHSWSALWSRAGIVFWGGFIGAVVLCVTMLLWRKKSVLRYADAAGPAMAAGYSIGRTGCWAVGDDYGRVWLNGWGAVAFPQGLPATTAGTMRSLYHYTLPADIPDSAVVGVYPTQLVEVVLGFIMFLILWKQRKNPNGPGWLFGLYCALASIERYLVELLRAKSDIVGWFTSAQLVALIVGTIGVLLMMNGQKHRGNLVRAVR